MTTPPADRAKRAAAALIVVTMFWGLSFPLVKSWQEAARGCPGGDFLASLTLIALRMLLATAALAAWRPRLALAPTRREHAAGALLGAVFTVGFTFQVWGMARTSPALSAFITSLGSAWVPLLAWAFLGIRAARLTLAGLAIGVGGTAVLGLNPEAGWAMDDGAAMTLISSVLFAVQILLLDRLGRGVRPSYLTVSFFLTSGLLALIGAMVHAAAGLGLGTWLEWAAMLLADASMLVVVGLLVLLPTVLAFHWMNTYQPQVSASRAALIYLLEPVFAALISVPWGYDELTGRLVLGGVLILLGNLLVEWRSVAELLRTGKKSFAQRRKERKEERPGESFPTVLSLLCVLCVFARNS